MADFIAPPKVASEDQATSADAVLRKLILQAGAEAAMVAPDRQPDLAERTKIARMVVTGEGQAEPFLGGLDGFYLPGLFNFALQLTRYRHCIADELTKLHRGEGQEPLLLAPAVVDFGR